MLLRWRATVFSLIDELGGDRPVALAARDEAQHLAARARVSPCAIAGPAAERRGAARSGAAPSSANTLACRVQLHPPASPSPSARQASPIEDARPREPRRARRAPASPAPRAGATAARPSVPAGELHRARGRWPPSHASMLAVDGCRDLLELARGARAASSSPAASTISTSAGSSRARRAGSVVSRQRAPDRGRAAPASPCASRSSASPGCGSQPSCSPAVRLLGRRERPGRRWSSPCRYSASPPATRFCLVRDSAAPGPLASARASRHAP